MGSIRKHTSITISPGSSFDYDHDAYISQPDFTHLKIINKSFMEAVYEGNEKNVLSHLANRIIDPKQLNDIKDAEGNTPLHIALQKPRKNRVMIRDLLQKYKEESLELNVKNNLEMTPLYIGIKNSNCSSTECHSEFWLNDLLTINGGNLAADVNLGGPGNETPVEIAVRRKCLKCIPPLVNAGGKLDFLLDDLDNAVVSGINLQDPTDKRTQYSCAPSCYKLQYDFRCILPYNDDDDAPKKETTFLELLRHFHTCHEVRKKIFLHPVVQAFLYMKWRRVRYLFYLYVFLSIVVDVLFTTYILTVYLHNCPYNSKGIVSRGKLDNELPAARQCDKGFGSLTYSVFLIIITLIMFGLRVYKCFRRRRKYEKLANSQISGRNFAGQFNIWLPMLLEFLLCPLILFSVWPVAWSSKHTLKGWQYSIAAYALFYTWASNLIYIRRFPNLGVYVEMVGKVLVKFGYLMCAYIFLLIAFAVSFLVIFPTYAPFQTIMRAVLKVLTMMTGDVEYAEFFYGSNENSNKAAATSSEHSVWFGNNDELLHPLTAHILYGTFVIICTIVLMNLLNGLAVEEIKELQKHALLSRIKREIEEVANLESIIFYKRGPLFGCGFVLPQCVILWLRRSISAINFSDSKTTSRDRFMHVVCPVHTSDRCFPTAPAIKHQEKKTKAK